MAFITVKAGASEISDGVYPVILTDISDPKTVTAQRGPNTGQDIDLLDWTFAIDLPGQPLDGAKLEASTSLASGPKSKMYAYLTALLGGVPPQKGQGFEKADLIGRMAIATIRNDEAGWPRIENLSAMPAGMMQQRFAAATGTPVQAPAGQPARSALNLQPAALPAGQPLYPGGPVAVGAGVGAGIGPGAMSPAEVPTQPAPPDELPF